MNKSGPNDPTPGKEPEAKKNEPEKHESKRSKLKLGSFEYEGPLEFAAAIIIGFIVGVVGLAALVFIFGQPSILVESLISKAVTATVGASISSFQATQTAFGTTAEAKVRPELQPTIDALETEVARLTAIPFTQIITVTQIVQVTPTPDETVSNVISIEDFPSEIFSFSGTGGYGELHVIRKEDDDLDYQFYYVMPKGGDGYAGIFFRFIPTINFTEFASLQATISFSDNDAICQIYLESQVGVKSYITLGNNTLINASADARMESEGDDRIFTIPLAGNFLDVPNKQSISGIGISSNTNLVEGSHSCTVQEIYLLK